MVVKLCLDGKIVNIVSAYARQAGCDEVEKVAFWEVMDKQLSAIPAEERLIIGGDMNRHIGRTRKDIERMHGGWEVGERNDEVERVVDCSMSFGLAIVNTRNMAGKESTREEIGCSRDENAQVDVE
ncbi:uncharacterized protein [Macrobrachium rosenbergii]|uniref:uncharacterized protein n=1 Tax=Macrobrachium rosenbergii TaxID=79674 RepID=UPI0034D4BFA9